METELDKKIVDQHDYVSRMAEPDHVKVLPVAFTMIYAHLSGIAREAGYALALHGTMMRDLDLIAVPWTSTAVCAEELVARFMAASSSWRRPNLKPVEKPHGRRCWSMHLGGGPYIDLSIMPREQDKHDSTDTAI